MADYIMTEDEHAQLTDIINEYWVDFSKLVAAQLNKVSPHLRSQLLMMLEDSSSVHGSDYGRYL